MVGAKSGIELGHFVHPAPQEPAELVGNLQRSGRDLTGEHVRVALPQAHMDVAARTGLARMGLGHEGDAQPERVGRLLHALLHEDVPVGHLQDLGVADVHLVLAASPFALGGLNRDPGACQVPAHGPVVGLLASPLQEVVVLDVPTDRTQIGVARLGRGPVAVFEDEVLELGGGFGRVAHGGGPLQLLAENRPGRHRHRLVSHCVVEIAQHDGGAVEPVGPPQGGQVGHHVEVAVSLFPVGIAVAGDRFHLHVDREQVVAGMGAVGVNVVEEEAGVVALPVQPSVMVGEPDHDGVDLVRLDQVPQFIDG